MLSLLRYDDTGVGVLTVVLVMAVLTALTVTATALTVNNLDNSRRDRQALSALATSEAGVAHAIQFLRGGNLGALTCTEPPAGAAPGASCTGPGPSWISATSPQEVLIDGATGACSPSGNCFKVWIGTVAPYVPNCAARHATPPTACSGVYRVHSTGLAGGGPGARKLAVDVKVTPYPFPIGVFAETFSGNGNIGIHHESVFTNGCISNRQDDSTSGSGFQFDWDASATPPRPVLDLVYDQPSAAHATGVISTSNTSCGSSGGGYPIHQTSKTNTTPKTCNTTFPYDQDSGGGALTAGDGCYGKYTRTDGSVYPTTSQFTSADLQTYGYVPRGLTDAQYKALQSQAQAQGTYNIATGSINSTLTGLAAAGISSPVLFWDIGDVSLKSSDFPASFRRALSTSAGCTGNSVTVVVMGHNLKLSGGNVSPYLVASMFVPDGTLTGQGGPGVIGTVFAKTIDLGGGVDFYMDQCFASNPPGGILDVQVTSWREDDAKDIN